MVKKRIDKLTTILRILYLEKFEKVNFKYTPVVLNDYKVFVFGIFLSDSERKLKYVLSLLVVFLVSFHLALFTGCCVGLGFLFGFTFKNRRPKRRTLSFKWQLCKTYVNIVMVLRVTFYSQTIISLNRSCCVRFCQ